MFDGMIERQFVNPIRANQNLIKWKLQRILCICARMRWIDGGVFVLGRKKVALSD